ncbi:flagellar export protein FliJ [Paenibacillus sp. MAHUQ-46]|uniref:Flagellar FliJ protein n=2 Tax=Paenibacillus TaxID=44249 RepID=A0A934J7U8_9BACL|nr:flagellar export protein FliJ [Paenibacillus roseus]MBJ6363379.1 flagellar export protein FliJ [Paenibacillus roseus]
MGKYRYPYQKIVDLKTSQKTQAEWMLSVAVGKLQLEEQSLEQLEEEKQHWADQLLEAAANLVVLSELRVMQQYMEHLEECIIRKSGDVKTAKMEVDRSKGYLTEKMMDEKVWLKAKENANGRFSQMILLKEQNELDEIASVRFKTAVRQA